MMGGPPSRCVAIPVACGNDAASAAKALAAWDEAIAATNEAYLRASVRPPLAPIGNRFFIPPAIDCASHLPSAVHPTCNLIRSPFAAQPALQQLPLARRCRPQPRRARPLQHVLPLLAPPHGLAAGRSPARTAVRVAHPPRHLVGRRRPRHSIPPCGKAVKAPSISLCMREKSPLLMQSISFAVHPYCRVYRGAKGSSHRKGARVLN